MLKLFTFFLRLERKNPERWISPWLFALVIVVLFAFLSLTEGNPQEIQVKSTLLQALLAFFFVIQLVMGRSLESETQDGFLTQMRLRGINVFSWFFAKSLALSLQIGFILTPTLIFIAAFSDQPLLFWQTFLTRAFAGSLGLIPLGFILQAACYRSHQQKILLPTLFFPLASPVFLMIAQGCLFPNDPTPLTLIFVFDAIYIVLSSVLFSELFSHKSRP